MIALLRDYSFLASAFLLEPCDLQWRKTQTYGLGRDRLPRAIAEPFALLADRLSAFPFMEYAHSYALMNYKKKDPNGGLVFENLELIRTFEGSEHEAGFILVHVTMDAHTGRLVKAAGDIIAAAKAKDRSALRDSLFEYYLLMKAINQEMETMWRRSSGDAYNNFRTFIMGIKNQPMFPNGVIYEGVSDEPRFYRGESGANDSIIPTCDNLFQVTKNLPTNPLTDILKDFRSYRPTPHNEWLAKVLKESIEAKVIDFAMENMTSGFLVLLNLEMIRQFRHRHWWFMKEYIAKFSSHPTATGGSPIISWLPNQLFTVMDYMTQISTKLKTNFQDINSIEPDIQEKALGSLGSKFQTFEELWNDLLKKGSYKKEELEMDLEDVIKNRKGY